MSRKVHDVFFYTYQDHNRSVYILHVLLIIVWYKHLTTQNHILMIIYLYTIVSFLIEKLENKAAI